MILKIPFEDDFRALAFFPDDKGALYLDVGANRGQSADAILMQTKYSRVQLFEPNPLLSKNLLNQYKRSHRVSACLFGLGDEAGQFELSIPYYKKWMFDGLASFSVDSAIDWLKNRIYFYKDNFLTIKRVPCQVKTLDELDLKPDFIKLDVQGFELNALKGGENTIKAHEPILLIETPDETIISYLKSLGYRHYAFKKNKFVADAKGNLNTFFMTEGKASLINHRIQTV